MKQAGKKMPGRVPAGKGLRYTNATAADPDAWKRERRDPNCTGWRLMIGPEVARVAGVTERTANRILSDYLRQRAFASRRGIEQTEEQTLEKTAAIMPASIADETLVRVVAVWHYLTHNLRSEADTLGDMLAEEAAFIMRQPMAGVRK